MNGPTQPRRISVLTLFPGFFQSVAKEDGVVSRAFTGGTVAFQTVNIRDFAPPPHRYVDDHPVGGGDGMVIQPHIAQMALDAIATPSMCVVHVTPCGHVFNQQWAQVLAKALEVQRHVVFLCGRYAGFDHRFSQKNAHHHLSVGDFVVSGGELPAALMIDALLRWVPGVLGNPESPQRDSFTDGLLEAPAYTKPLSFVGEDVPPVLLSGNHKEMARYNRKQQIVRTARFRPDLILAQWDSLTSAEKTWAKSQWKHGTPTS